LHGKTVQKVVVCITDSLTAEVIEKWQFNVECDKTQTTESTKSEKQINKEIQAVLRQITSTVSFLPLVENQCVFDLQAYTDQNAEVPEEWGVSDEKSVANAVDMPFREISTGHHTVKSGVSYRGDND
jgi:mitotic spindle assembly checkpoint protein MAD2